MKIPINQIVVSKDNPRQTFNNESLQQLSESIGKRGLLQPIIVRQRKDGKYDLVVGERRFRAGKLQGLTEIEAVVKDLDDRECDFYRLIENTEREDLTDVEKGNGISHILETYDDLTIGDIAKELHKSENLIKIWLMKSSRLSEFVKKCTKSSTLSDSVVGLILPIHNHDEQDKIAKAIIDFKVPAGEHAEKQIEFIKRYRLNPEEYPTVESLESLANEVKGIKKVKIDLAKLSPEARKEVNDIIDEAKAETKKIRQSAKPRKRVNVQRQGRPKKTKTEIAPTTAQATQPAEETKAIPELTIPKETKTIVVSIGIPEPLWEKLHLYMQNSQRPLMLENAIIELLQSHPAL